MKDNFTFPFYCRIKTAQACSLVNTDQSPPWKSPWVLPLVPPPLPKGNPHPHFYRHHFLVCQGGFTLKCLFVDITFWSCPFSTLEKSFESYSTGLLLYLCILLFGTSQSWDVADCRLLVHFNTCLCLYISCKLAARYKCDPFVRTVSSSKILENVRARLWHSVIICYTNSFILIKPATIY